MTTMSASDVFTLVDGRKNITRASCTMLRPSLAQVYRSRMQQPNAACTRALPQCKSCPCVTCIWLLHPAPTYFGGALHQNEGLLENSLLLNSLTFPIVQGHTLCLHLRAARVPKHYIILHDITLHNITIHYITLHYIT